MTGDCVLMHPRSIWTKSAPSGKTWGSVQMRAVLLNLRIWWVWYMFAETVMCSKARVRSGWNSDPVAAALPGRLLQGKVVLSLPRVQLQWQRFLHGGGRVDVWRRLRQSHQESWAIHWLRRPSGGPCVGRHLRRKLFYSPAHISSSFRWIWMQGEKSILQDSVR